MSSSSQRPFIKRACAALLLASFVIPAFAQEATNTADTAGSDSGPQPLQLDAKWLNAFQWRGIGPAGMGGRITDFAVFEADPITYWVATAGGGLLKTTNNGNTFVHQFEHEGSSSIGSVSVAPSDRNIVWVGTGENNPRNSVSYGDGVYKSTNGGRTWKHMGLGKSFQIGRIAINPTNANIVYVGALGRLYGPNEERGLYQTADGGETWQRSLYIDDKTGIIDVRMNPADPNMLLAASWERRRDEYDSHPGDPPMADGYDRYDPIVKWGPGGGIYKTTDAGAHWRKLTNGLPDCNLGRIGLDFFRKDPKTIFAIIDSENIGKGSNTVVDVDITAESVEGGMKITEIARTNGPSSKAGLKVDDIVKSVGGTPATDMPQLTDLIREHRAGEAVKYSVQRAGTSLDITVTMELRPDPATSGAILGLTGEDAENGVKVTAVTDNGPASQAGVKVDDVLQALGDQNVTAMNQVTDELASRSAGDKLKLKLLRDGQSQEIEVTLAARPQGVAAGGRRGGGRGRRGGAGATNNADVAVAANAPGGGGGGRGGGSATRPTGANLGGQQENVLDPDGWKYGGIYKSTDGGESWKRINSYNPRPMYFSLLKVDPSDDRYVYAGGVHLYRSANFGRTFRDDVRGGQIHDDEHALWIDPRDGRHMMIGCDGGFFVSYDRGDNWDHLNTSDIGQFYNVSISLRQPYFVAGGLQDNGSWFGPTQSLSGAGPINEDWMNVGGGDGFITHIDANDPDLVYSESQDGSINRRNVRTGERGSISPRGARGGGGGGGGGNRRGGGAPGTNAVAQAGEGGGEATNAAAVGGGGGGRGGRGGGGRGGGPAYNFNWNTPFILSSHNSRIFYSAGDYVFRSVDRGNDLRVVSPKITLTPHGSATALAESPTNLNVVYVGTDDGALWVTRDYAQTWSNITANVGLPKPLCVASIEASRFVEGRAYVAFDGHRSDMDDPGIYVTEDFGKTWKSIRANLPWGSSRVLREDITNPNLLFLGTEFGAWCSLDRGVFWNKFGTNFPTVSVQEFAFHPVNGEVVAATHGRSLWVLDAAPLRQIKADYVTDSPMLYKPADTVQWRGEPQHGGTLRRFVGQNPPTGPQIYYSLPKAAESVTIKIMDIAGNTVRQANGSNAPGFYRFSLAGGGGRGGRGGAGAGAGGGGQRAAAGAGAGRGAGAAGGAARGGGGGGGGRGGFGGGLAVGSYRVVLTVDGKEFSQVARVEADPTMPTAMSAEEMRAQEAADAQEEDKQDSDSDEKDTKDIREIDRHPAGS